MYTVHASPNGLLSFSFCDVGFFSRDDFIVKEEGQGESEKMVISLEYFIST